MPDYRPVPLHEAAERVRRLGQRTPRWTLHIEDGRPVVRDDAFHQVVFRIEGMWTPDLVHLLGAYSTDALVALAELLWMISASNCSTRVVNTAQRLVQALDLDGNYLPPEIKAVVDAR